MLKRRVWVSTLIVAVLVVGAGVALVGSRYVYKQWPWESYPNPLSWCGRRWIPAESFTLAQILNTDYDFRRSGDLPGILNRGAVWTSRAKGATEFGTRCKITNVWVQLSANRFEAMGLSGSF